MCRVCEVCGVRVIGRLGQVCACSPDWTIGEGDKASIEYHMRNVHIGESRRWVVRDMSKAAARFPRKVRHACIRYALECHERNKDLYYQVMRG